MESNALAGDDLRAFTAHTEFHHLLYAAAGSPTLLGILEGLWDETERYRHAVKHYRSDPSHLGRRAPPPDRAPRDRHPAQAAREMRAHLTRTLDALLRARDSNPHILDC